MFELCGINSSCTVVWWLAPLPHSKRVQFPTGTFLCGVSPHVCVGSLCVLWLPPTVQKSMHVNIIGVPKLSLGVCGPVMDWQGTLLLTQ